MRHIVITNCYSDDNRGSAALLDAACVIAARAFPGAEIALISSGTSRSDRAEYRHSLATHPLVRLLPPLLAVSHTRLQKLAIVSKCLLWQTLPARIGGTETAETLRQADFVFSCGGYLLFDRGSVRQWLKAYLLLLMPFLLAHRMRTPTWTMPTSVIEPTTRFGALALRAVVRSFDCLVARDPHALAVARAMGARTRLCADSAFILPTPSMDDVARALVRFGVSGERYAVLTTRSLGDASIDRRKLQLQAAAIRDMLAGRAIDRIVVLAQTVGPELDERPSRDELRDMIGDHAVCLDGDFSHRDLMALYAGARFVLAQHLHSFIFSTMVGTPALVFSTDGAKVEGLVAGLGLPDWFVIDPRVEDAASLTCRLERLLSSRDEVTRQLLHAAADAHASIESLIGDLATHRAHDDTAAAVAE